MNGKEVYMFDFFPYSMWAFKEIRENAKFSPKEYGERLAMQGKRKQKRKGKQK